MSGSDADTVHPSVHMKHLHMPLTSVIFCHTNTQSNSVIENNTIFDLSKNLGYVCTYHGVEREMTRRYGSMNSLAYIEHVYGVYWDKRKIKLNHES